MEEIATVYGRSLFEVAMEHGNLDTVREQIGQFADVLGDEPGLQTFFFSPYFSTDEKCDGLAKAVTDADEVVVNFLQLLIEKHRVPAIFRIRRELDRLWLEENKMLPVQVTSAIKLDDALVKNLGETIGKSTGRKVDLLSLIHI